jgi:hypothetical protein
LKININNSEKISEALAKAQARATARTIDNDFVLRAVAQAEMRLRKILAKKDWQGLQLSVTCAPGKMASSYRGIPMATYAVVQRGASGWFLVQVARAKARENFNDVVIHGVEQKGKLVSEYVAKTLGRFEVGEDCT